MKVLFVCTGNTCRSPMAEGIMKDLSRAKDLGIEASSAGILTMDGLEPSENSVLAMEDIGLDISGHRARQLTQEILDESDLVLTMSRSHMDNILMHFQIDRSKLHTVISYAYGREGNIVDPYGMDYGMYRKTRDEIKGALEKIDR